MDIGTFNFGLAGIGLAVVYTLGFLSAVEAVMMAAEAGRDSGFSLSHSLTFWRPGIYNIYAPEF